MANPTSPPTRARGEYAKTAARRAEIVRAGLEVFAVGGYHAASIREIADKVGLSQAGVLHHFANKWELLSAVLTLRDADALTWIVPGDGVPGITIIRQFLDLVTHNVDVPGLIELHCVLAAESTHVDHPAHAYFADRYRWTIETISAAFEDMRERGQLRPGIIPRSAAIQTMALMDGLQVQWLLDRSSLDMREELHRYLMTIATVEI